MKKNNTGITLVALVITIIVLIILAGVSINSVMNGGLIDNAKVAKDQFSKTAESELQDIDSLSVKTDLLIAGASGELVDSTFSIIDEKIYITGIKSNERATATTAGELLEGLGEEYKVVNTAGTAVAATETVTTGYKIMKGEEEYATIVVRGDIDFDKYINDSSYLIDLITAGEYTNAYEGLAADINNDGKISSDDLNLVELLNLERIDENEIQKAGTSKLPTVINEYIYKWYTEEELISRLASEYTVSGTDITVSTITCEDLEESIKELINIDGTEVEVVNAFGIPIQDNAQNVASGNKISIKVPWKISETEYTKEGNINLEITVQ